MAYRIEVDDDLCIASKNCIHAAPDVFELSEDQIAVVVDANGAPDHDIIEAARHCPVDAISVFDAATNRRVYP